MCHRYDFDIFHAAWLNPAGGHEYSQSQAANNYSLRYLAGYLNSPSVEITLEKSREILNIDRQRLVGLFPDDTSAMIQPVEITRNYGEYEDCMVVQMRDQIREVNITSQVVLMISDQGTTSHYYDKTFVNFDSKFYSLIEAYNAGHISRTDVFKAGRIIGSGFAYDEYYELERKRVKIDPELAEIIKNSSDETQITVWIFLKDINRVIVDAAMNHKYESSDSWSNVYNDYNDYDEKRRAIEWGMTAEQNDAFIEKYIAGKERDVLYNSRTTSTIIVEATIAEIEEYAQLEEIYDLSLHVQRVPSA